LFTADPRRGPQRVFQKVRAYHGYIPPERSKRRSFIAFFFIPSNVLLGQYRGFGFVTYKNQEDAEDAAYKTDGREFDGRVLEVNIARMKVVAVLFPPYSLSR
jgi:RNA recognition motif-containing protein